MGSQNGEKRREAESFLSTRSSGRRKVWSPNVSARQQPRHNYRKNKKENKDRERKERGKQDSRGDFAENSGAAHGKAELFGPLIGGEGGSGYGKKEKEGEEVAKQEHLD